MRSAVKSFNYRYRLAFWVAAAFLFTVALTLIWRPALAEERNFHRICTADEVNLGNPNHCLLKSAFVQHRDRCEGNDATPCFGVGPTSDGWIADLVVDGKCGLKSVACIPTPFRYATLEYKTNGMVSASRWQGEQLEEIIKEIRKSGKVFVVTYVHGWHHDAREEIGKEFREKDLKDLPEDKTTQDRNLLFFKHILAKTRWELDRSGRREFRLLGVYVGWDGGPPNAVLNAGDRARAATRLGLSDDFDSDMKAIGQAVSDRASSGSRMILIGHSFGGRAVSHFMLKNALGGRHDLTPLGVHNLAVTINPAISADFFDQYMKLPSETGNPGWINFTSKDDWVTRTGFPIGSLLPARLLGAGAGLNNTWFSPATGRTIGHYAAYQTHELSICHLEKTGDCSGKIRDCGTVQRQSLRRPTGWYKFTDARAPAACAYLCPAYGQNSLECGADQYLSVLSRLNEKHLPRARPAGNMWNVITDKDVIGPELDYQGISAIEHNAFVQTNLTRMLVELVNAR